MKHVNVYITCQCPAVYNVFTHDILNTNDSWEETRVIFLAHLWFASFRSSDRRCCLHILHGKLFILLTTYDGIFSHTSKTLLFPGYSRTCMVWTYHIAYTALMLYLNPKILLSYGIYNTFCSWHLKRKHFHEGILTTNSTALQDPLENCTWWYTSIVVNQVNVLTDRRTDRQGETTIPDSTSFSGEGGYNNVVTFNCVDSSIIQSSCKLN